jgi:hypothetical protein
MIFGPQLVVPAALAASGIYLVVLAVRSLGWHLYGDAPILLYAAYLVDRQSMVPYRDIFEMNAPGVYAANVLIGRLSGYSDLGVRFVDLASLGVVLVLTYAVMRRFGRAVAWCATIFFGDLYLASGESMSLQREYLMLVPMCGAVSVTLAPDAPRRIRAFGSALLIGVATTIRPDAALALPLLTYFVGTGKCQGAPASGGQVWTWAAAGFAVPVLAAAFYLWLAGALESFVDIAVNYWPLYNAISGSPRPHVMLSDGSRLRYLVANALSFGPHPGLPLLAAGSIGTFVALRRSTLDMELRRAVFLLAGLTALCWLHVAIAGKFWVYHWLPFSYFAILLGSLGLVESPPGEFRRRTIVAVFVLLCVGLPWRIGPFRTPHRFPHGDVTAIGTFLAQRLEPGDTVAPLDWTEGAVHAMLLARATPATPFLYDFHFYHHVSSPYIERLRRRFLAALERAPPRYFIRIDRPGRFAGPDTSANFDELAGFISARYVKAVTRAGYEIWQRRE